MSEAFGDGRLVRILRTEERIGAFFVHSQEGVIVVGRFLVFSGIEGSGVGFLGAVVVYVGFAGAGC